MRLSFNAFFIAFAAQIVTGEISGPNDNDISSVKCPEEYTLTQCYCHPDRRTRCDGSWIRISNAGESCIVYNTRNFTSGVTVNVHWFYILQFFSRPTFYIISSNVVTSSRVWRSRRKAGCPVKTTIMLVEKLKHNLGLRPKANKLVV